MTANRKRQQLRIIGGQFRGRTLPIVDADGLRPTANRIRETLFNWLQYDIAGKCCLDAFAGTGALGIEALSRGAKYVTFCETHRQAQQQLADNLHTLEMSNAEVVKHDGLTRLQAGDAAVIFLDPPYALNVLPEAMNIVASLEGAQQPELIYLEHNRPLTDIVSPLLDVGFVMHREKKAGTVYYGLLKRLLLD